MKAWWDALHPAEQTLYVGLILLAAGCAMFYPPAALIVPGAVLTALGASFVLRMQPDEEWTVEEEGTYDVDVAEAPTEEPSVHARLKQRTAEEEAG